MVLKCIVNEEYAFLNKNAQLLNFLMILGWKASGLCHEAFTIIINSLVQ